MPRLALSTERCSSRREREFAFEKMMPLIARGNITGEPEILSPFRVFVRS